MTIQIKCVLVEWKAMEMGQYGEAYCVTFRVGTDPHTFDVIVKAHTVLHDLTSRIAEQTARWKQ
jgi:hypothetical protein